MQNRRLKAGDLNAYLPEGFRVIPVSRGIQLVAPDSTLAQDLFWGAKRYLKATAEEIRGIIQITWEGCSEPLEVKPPNLPPLRAVAKPDFEMDLTQLYKGDKPTYINQISDQSNLWCNLAALQAQGKKPGEFLIVQNAFALNYEDELQRRMELLTSDGSLTNYEYRALRWHRDEGGVWVRRQMAFCSDFHLIDYLGERCWLGIVQTAEAADRHEDGVLI